MAGEAGLRQFSRNKHFGLRNILLIHDKKGALTNRSQYPHQIHTNPFSPITPEHLSYLQMSLESIAKVLVPDI